MIEFDTLSPFWEKPDTDSVVAVILKGKRFPQYDLRIMDTMHSTLSRRKMNSFHTNILIKNLSADTLILLKGVSPINPEKEGTGDCFQPHHGLFFYKKGEIVARIAIDFTCNNYWVDPRNSGKLYLKNARQMYKLNSLPTYNWDDPMIDSLEYTNAKFKYGDYFKKE